MGGREEEEDNRYLYPFLGAAHPLGRPYKFHFQGRLTPQAAPKNGPYFQRRPGGEAPLQITLQGQLVSYSIRALFLGTADLIVRPWKKNGVLLQIICSSVYMSTSYNDQNQTRDANTKMGTKIKCNVL